MPEMKKVLWKWFAMTLAFAASLVLFSSYCGKPARFDIATVFWGIGLFFGGLFSYIRGSS